MKKRAKMYFRPENCIIGPWKAPRKAWKYYKNPHQNARRCRMASRREGFFPTRTQKWSFWGILGPFLVLSRASRSPPRTHLETQNHPEIDFVPKKSDPTNEFCPFSCGHRFFAVFSWFVPRFFIDLRWLFQLCFPLFLHLFFSLVFHAFVGSLAENTKNENMRFDT